MASYLALVQINTDLGTSDDGRSYYYSRLNCELYSAHRCRSGSLQVSALLFFHATYLRVAFGIPYPLESCTYAYSI